jgi:hypothetical protein
MGSQWKIGLVMVGNTPGLHMENESCALNEHPASRE